MRGGKSKRTREREKELLQPPILHTNSNYEVAKNHLYVLLLYEQRKKFACNNSRYNVYIERFDEYFFRVLEIKLAHTNTRHTTTLSLALFFSHYSFFSSYFWPHCHIGLIIKFTIVFRIYTHAHRTHAVLYGYCTAVYTVHIEALELAIVVLKFVMKIEFFLL